jgi:cytochrome c biogenesis protein CcdA
LYNRLSLSEATGDGLLLLAVTAGLASLFSPCSFPLLVSLLAREAGGQSTRGLLRTALAFTFGVTLFLLILGAGLALGAAPIITRLSFTSAAGRLLRIVVGLALIIFGFWQVQARSLNFAWLNRVLQPLWMAQSGWRYRQSVLGHGLYGFGYILAGFG